MYIYVLELEYGNYYVGRTSDIQGRVKSHFDGTGSSWTQKYKPVRLVETIENADAYDEDKVTLKYMEVHGIERVRGGSFSRIHLTREEHKTLTQMLRGNHDRCFRCGEVGHFVSECSSNAYESWTIEEDDRLRDEMRSGMSLNEMCEKHGRTKGAIRSRMKRLENTLVEPLLTDAEEDSRCWCL